MNGSIITSILYSSTAANANREELDKLLGDNPLGDIDIDKEDPDLSVTVAEDELMALATDTVTLDQDYPLGSSPPSWLLNMTTISPTISITTTTTNVSEGVGVDCSASLDYNYDLSLTAISVALFVAGLFFCIFGYRCFKIVLFLTGFSFALVITFGLCQVEELLPQYGNVGISMLAGVLYGLICFLVPYVGFFTLGFLAGLLSGLASMLFIPGGYSVWVSVIFLIGAGLFGAVANVCWPTLSVLTTSLVGGAGIALCFDYFVEKGRMALWLWAHVYNQSQSQESLVEGAPEGSGGFCWFSWLLLALWPTLMVVGLLVQWTLTANGFSIEIYGYHESKRVPVRRRLTREERALARQAKYRYLYHVRTAGGDYISQAYLQFLQNSGSSPRTGGPHADTLSTHMSTLPTSSHEDSTAN